MYKEWPMDPLVMMVCEHEAQLRWESGEIPCFSSDVADQLTCGYGDLSYAGYFQFPLYPAELYLEKIRVNEINEL